MESQEQEIEDLEERRKVEVVDSEEWSRGAGDEDTGLVDGIVGGVEGAIVLEWGGGDWK